jgi:hypothetical protein
VPGHKKLLPRPCPQCGQENGGVQFVFFNPRYYKERTGYDRSYHAPYHILRISHYSKDAYKSGKGTKTWHNVRFRRDFPIGIGNPIFVKEEISIDQLFDRPDYADVPSVTLRLTPKNAEFIKKHGWKKVLMTVDHHAHWFNKDGLKKCPRCDAIVTNLKKSFVHYDEEEEYSPTFDWHWYIWLCEKCTLEKETKRLAKREKIIVRSSSLS